MCVKMWASNEEEATGGQRDVDKGLAGEVGQNSGEDLGGDVVHLYSNSNGCECECEWRGNSRVDFLEMSNSRAEGGWDCWARSG